jgi:hypothetical protein
MAAIQNAAGNRFESMQLYFQPPSPIKINLIFGKSIHPIRFELVGARIVVGRRPQEDAVERARKQLRKLLEGRPARAPPDRGHIKSDYLFILQRAIPPVISGA